MFLTQLAFNIVEVVLVVAAGGQPSISNISEKSADF